MSKILCMVEEHEKGYSKYFFIVLFLLVIYMSYLIIQELLGALISAVLLAYLFYPAYEWLGRKVKSNHFASFLTIVLILVIIFTPMIFITQALVQQTQITYTALKSTLQEDGSVTCTEATSKLCELYSNFVQVLEHYGLQKTASSSLIHLGKMVYQFSSQIIFTLPKKIFQFVVMMITLFYLFIDGKKIYHWFVEMLPLKKKHAHHLMEQIKDTTYAVMYGQVVISIIQGVAGTVIFFIFGVPHALLLGVAMTILAILPMVGVGLVWLPIALYYLITGISQNIESFVVKGILLLILYGIIVWPLEFILKPRVIGDRAKLHSLIIFVGVIGGIAFFGALGMILGPLVLSILVTMVRIYWEEHHHEVQT